MDLLTNLNPEQKSAVTHGEGPLLIVAGAGTGKTTVITQRVAWLIAQGKAQSDEILAVTFTDKAAGEMSERVDRLLPLGYLDLWISTFHSFCQRVLQDHSVDIGLSTDFTLLDQTSQWLLIRQNLDRFNLDYYRPLGNPTKFIHVLLKHFSRAKDEVIGPGEYLEYVEGLRLDLDTAEATGGGKQKVRKSETNSKLKAQNSKQKNDKETDVVEISRLEEVADAYHVYQQILLENNAIDFGDLINYTLKLFQTRPNILEQYREKFKYILADEFQDTNWAQYELIKLLAAPRNNLTVVADDDQCLPSETKIETRDGQKRIDAVRRGDEVVTAVGKGYVSFSRVNRVMKQKKQSRFVTLRTERGYIITATDNHKFFVHVPTISNKRYYFVYLMHRLDVGWRLGVTNDLASRLRLERSADLIIALRSFKTETSVRYYETFWSLKYGIPTGVFKERKGTVIKDDLLKRLYQELDVASNVKRFADDLGIDLSAHHVAFAGVRRGSKSRIKINLQLCQRRFTSKTSRGKPLVKPLVRHYLSLETSDQGVVKKLRNNGFRLHKTKKGYCLRRYSQDLAFLGKEALRLQQITHGIIDHKAYIGRLYSQHLPARVVPLKNICPGLYIPVKTEHGIVYDQVVERTDTHKNIFVYDLEVDRTHNFIANGVVVHNSIYKFRGASVANVTQFVTDFSDLNIVSLLTNYRSRQMVLDVSHRFIQQNNPYRLEAQSLSGKRVSKELVAFQEGEAKFEYLLFTDQYEEARGIVERIIELEQKNREVTFNDFAILIRANSQADVFVQAFEHAQIPYQFVASRGLYVKRVILDVINFMKLLDDYHESPSLWRVLNWPVFQFSVKTIVGMNHYARKKAWSLYQSLYYFQTSEKVDTVEREEIARVVALIEKYTQLANTKRPREVMLGFLEDSGYLKWLTNQDDAYSRQQVSYLEQFDKRLREFETSVGDPSVKLFLEEMQMEIDSGETGSLEIDLDAGPEAVKILTVHASKGLEFRYVFIVNMVDKRFPAIARRDPIKLPDALVKEQIPEGDIHLQEERRLFYVALTRAKHSVYLTAAEDYGGKTKKKPSRFLYELELVGKEQKVERTSESVLSSGVLATHSASPREYQLPAKVSFTQLKAFETCPYQYRFAHVLRVPVRANYSLSFGKSMHGTLKRFLESFQERGDSKQGDLFTSTRSTTNDDTKDHESIIPSLKELLQIYDEEWIDDWYESSAHKEQYREKGKSILKDFHRNIVDAPPSVAYLEQGFNLKIEDPSTKKVYTIFGVIDRIDTLDDGHVEIIDYKTGTVKNEKTIDKDQLLIYQIAACEVLDMKPLKLTYYYLDENKPVSFLGTDEEIEKLKSRIVDFIERVHQSDFAANPSPFKCKYCDYRNICEYRQL